MSDFILPFLWLVFVFFCSHSDDNSIGGGSGWGFGHWLPFRLLPINVEFHLFHMVLWGGIIAVAIYCFYAVVHTNIVTADSTQVIERTRPIAHQTNRMTPHPHRHKHTSHAAHTSRKTPPHKAKATQTHKAAAAHAKPSPTAP